MDGLWKKLMTGLPLCAAEGGRYEEVEADKLAQCIAEDVEDARTVVALIQTIFCKMGLLDPLRAKEGRWRFVSYPARLCACSLLSLLMDERGLFHDGFWSAGMGENVPKQHNVLHALETLREEGSKALPLRRTFVAWGVVRREGNFILKKRESLEDDPDNALHGNYGFPGGRVSLLDLDPDPSASNDLALLYGLPGSLSKEEEKRIARALERTLVRELQEELKLEFNTHYKFSKAAFQRQPKTFLHGANAQHCITECRSALFEIELTSRGDARLAFGVKESELFSLEEMMSPCLTERKAFLDQADESFLQWLNALKDSASELRLKRSDLSKDPKETKGEEPIDVVLPLSEREPLVIGDCEISLSDPEVELLLLLGFAARNDTALHLLSPKLELGHWGWVRMNESKPLLLEAQRLNQKAERIAGAPILWIHDASCRLRAGGDNVFFSPNLFQAELRKGEFLLRRCSLDGPECFRIDAKTWSVSLSEPNWAHLNNLKCGRTDQVTYDNLRKLKDKSNRYLDDFVRSCGLHRLYAPRNDTLSKELQEFRFVIDVRSLSH